MLQIEPEFKRHHDNTPGKEREEVVHEFLQQLFRDIITHWNKRNTRARSPGVRRLPLAETIVHSLRDFGTEEFRMARVLVLAQEIRPEKTKQTNPRRVVVKDAQILKSAPHLRLFDELTQIEHHMHKSFKALVDPPGRRCGLPEPQWMMQVRHLITTSLWLSQKSKPPRNLVSPYPTVLRCQKPDSEKPLSRYVKRLLCSVWWLCPDGKLSYFSFFYRIIVM